MANSKKPLVLNIYPTTLSITEEDAGSGRKKIVAKGEFGIAGEETSNKRIYPKELIKREIAKLQDDIKKRRLFGELDHPGDGKTKLSRVSHLIRVLELKDNGTIYGEAEILDTTNGKNLQAILEAGGQVGVSSRGFGSVKLENGKNIVQNDYNLVTFDFVANPAVTSAYPKYFVEGENEKVDVDIVLDDIERDFPHLFDEMRNRVEKQIREEIDSTGKENLEEILKQKEREIREEIEKEYLSESEAMVFKKVKEAIAPLIAGDEIAKKLAKIESERDKAMEMAKIAGFQLFVERELAGDNNKDLIISMLGDLSQYKDVDEIKERIEKIKESQSRFEERIKKEKEKVDELKEENEKIEEQKEMIEAENMVRKALIGNPYIEQAVDEVVNGADADVVIQKYRNRKPSKLFSTLQERKLDEINDKEIYDVEEKEDDVLEGKIFGVDIREIVQINRKLNKKGG